MIPEAPRLTAGARNPPRLVKAGDDPAYAALSERFNAQDWSQFEAMVAGTEPYRRLAALRSLALDEGTKRAAALAYAEARPESAVAKAILAGCYVIAAWSARGSGAASQVAEGAWGDFFAGIAEAESLLVQARKLEPTDPLPRALSLITSRALEKPLTETQARFEELNEALPWAPAGASGLVQALAPKWGGTREELVAFGKRLVAEAPEGSPALGQVAALIIELWVSDLMDPKARPKGRAFEDPELKALAAQAAARSYLSAAWPGDRLDTAPTLNLFAFLAWKHGDRDAAKVLFERLGGAVTEDPWNYSGGSPLAAFEKAGRSSRTTRATRWIAIGLLLTMGAVAVGSIVACAGLVTGW